MRCERVEPAGDPVVEAGAERDQQVGLLQRRHRRYAAVHARHAEMLAMAVRKRATGHQRGHDRNAGELGQPAQPVGRMGPDHAATDVEDRALGLRDQPRCLPDLLAVRPDHRSIPGQLHLGWPDERRSLLQHVLRQVDQHRSGTAGASQMERFRDGLRHFGGGLHQEVVLGDRQRDPGDVRLLEGVRSDEGAPDLPGDGH